MRTLMIAFAGLAAGVGIPHLDDSKAPPLRLEVQIDGKSHEIREGDKTSIEIAGKQHEVVVRSLPNRTFAAAGMSFDYPAGMSFESENDADLGIRIWTMTGNDTVVMVYEFDEGSPIGMSRELLQNTVDQFDKGKVEATELKIGGKPQKAFKAVAYFDDEPMTFFTFPTARKDRCCVVMVQDTSDSGKGIADETKDMLKSLDKTFRTTKK